MTFSTYRERGTKKKSESPTGIEIQLYELQSILIKYLPTYLPTEPMTVKNCTSRFKFGYLKNFAVSKLNPFPLFLFFSHFTISFLEIRAISNCFSFPLGVRVHQSGKYRSIRYMEISEMGSGNFGQMDCAHKDTSP